MTAAERVKQLQATKLELEIADLRKEADKDAARFFHTGKFQLVGSISESSVAETVGIIESYCGICRHRGEPIHVRIHLNSGGGTVTDGLYLVDYLHQLRCEGGEVTITAMGEAQSMAAVILQAATTRQMTPRAVMMLHEISGNFRGSISQQRDIQNLMKLLEKHTVDLLCSRSSLTPEQLVDMQERKDIYLSAEKALELGLIDEIVSEAGLNASGSSAG